MSFEMKNPWESLNAEYVPDKFNEPQEIFNNIKLNDFPFLKSQFSSVEYLVKCKVCGVILLPDLVNPHYVNRHGKGSSPENISRRNMLPYHAISWIPDKNETPKKERHTLNKRSKNQLKRSQSDIQCKNKSAAPIEVLSETDSLSSATDDTFKRHVNTPVEEHERLREPVLLKLAKSEGHLSILNDGTSTQMPGNICDVQHPPERSVWSVVCPHERTRPTTEKIPPDRESPSQTCNLPSIEAKQEYSTVTSCARLSDSLTPAVEDNLYVSANILRRTGEAVRAISHSPAHSSSSSSVGGYSDTQTNRGERVLQASRKLKLHRIVSSDGIPRASKRDLSGALNLQVQERNSASNKQVVEDVSQQPLESSNFPSRIISTSALESHRNSMINCRDISKEATRNGFHSWFRSTKINNRPTLSRNEKVVTQHPGFGQVIHWRQHSAFRQRGKRIHDSRVNWQPLKSNSDELSEYIFDDSDPPATMRPVERRLSGVSEKPRNIWSQPVVAARIFRAPTEEAVLRAECAEYMTKAQSEEVESIYPGSSMQHTLGRMNEQSFPTQPMDLRAIMREAREKHLNRLPCTSSTRRTLPTTTVRSVIPSHDTVDLTSDAVDSQTTSSKVSSSAACIDRTAPGLDESRSCRSHPGPRFIFHTSPVGEYDSPTLPTHETSSTTSRQSSGDLPGFTSQSVGYNHLSNRCVRRLSCQDATFTAFAGSSAEIDDPLTSYSLSPSIHLGRQIPDQRFALHQGSSLPSDTVFAEPDLLFGPPSVTEEPTPSLQRRVRLPKRRNVYGFPCITSRIAPNRMPQRYQTAYGHPSQTPSRGVSYWANVGINSPVLLPEAISPESSALMEPLVDVVPGVEGYLTNSDIPYHTQLDDTNSTGIDPSMSHYAFHGIDFPHPQPGSSTSVLSNRYQVVREAQGRVVVVDDCREKSITGRSRKVARANFRHSAAVSGFPGSTYTNLGHVRFPRPMPPVQGAVSYIATNRKPGSVNIYPSSSLSQTNPVLDGLNITNSIPSATLQYGREAVGSILPPFSSGSSQLCQRIQRSVTTASGSTYSDPSTLLSVGFPGQPELESDATMNDQPEDSTINPNFTLLNPHIQQPIVNFSPHPVSTAHFTHSQDAGRLATINNNQAMTGQLGPVLCGPNRLFLIRPGSISRSPSMLLRTKCPTSIDRYQFGQSSANESQDRSSDDAGTT